MSPADLQSFENALDMLMGIVLALGAFIGYILAHVLHDIHAAYRLWRYRRANR